MRAQLLDAGVSVHDYGVLELRGGVQRRALEAIFRRAEEYGFETLILDADSALLKQIDRLAVRFRVNVAIINRPGGCATIEALHGAMAGRSERIGVAVDTGRLVLAGENPADAFARLKDRVFVVHLTDVTAGSPCPLGRGRVDFAAIINAVRQTGYDRLVTIPCDGFGEAAQAALEGSLEYLKKVAGGR